MYYMYQPPPTHTHHPPISTPHWPLHGFILFLSVIWLRSAGPTSLSQSHISAPAPPPPIVAAILHHFNLLPLRWRRVALRLICRYMYSHGPQIGCLSVRLGREGDVAGGTAAERDLTMGPSFGARREQLMAKPDGPKALVENVPASPFLVVAAFLPSQIRAEPWESEGEN